MPRICASASAPTKRNPRFVAGASMTARPRTCAISLPGHAVAPDRKSRRHHASIPAARVQLASSCPIWPIFGPLALHGRRHTERTGPRNGVHPGTEQAAQQIHPCAATVAEVRPLQSKPAAWFPRPVCDGDSGGRGAARLWPALSGPWPCRCSISIGTTESTPLKITLSILSCFTLIVHLYFRTKLASCAQVRAAMQLNH